MLSEKPLLFWDVFYFSPSQDVAVLYLQLPVFVVRIAIR